MDITVTLDLLARWIGWAVLAGGGIATTAAILGLCMNYGWRKYQDLLAYNELRKAVQEYREKHETK